jgi:iron complex outermembrane receptor protein
MNYLRLAWGWTIVGLLSIATPQSVWAQTEPITNSSLESVGDRPTPAITLKEWSVRLKEHDTKLMAQSNPVAITNVQIVQTDTGLEIVLDTPEGQTLTIEAQRFTQIDNRLIADIPNAVLALPDATSFLAENPTPDIATITATQQTSDLVRITITGTQAPPTTEVTLTANGLAYSLNPEAEAEDEEVVVTGAGQRGYQVPNASTATRTDTPILDTPQSIQVIPQQILEDQQIIRVDDALRNVSGVVGRLDAFGTSTRLTLRGFTTDNFTAGSILRDGFRVTDNLGTQETANIERIEVIKGPASVLFGQNDPGGIINLVTKRPLLDPFYELEFQAGSFGLIRPSLDISGPLTNDRALRYRLNVAYQHEDGFRDFETDTERFFIAPVLSWDISDRTNLTLILEHTDEENPFDLGIPAFGNAVVDIPRDRIVAEPDDFLKNRSLTLGYDFKHQFSDNWTLNHGFRYVTQDYNVLTVLPFFVDEATGDITRFFADREYHSDDYTIQTNVVGKFKTGLVQHTLLAGVDLNFNRFDEQFTRLDLNTPVVLNIFNPIYGTIPRPDFNTLDPLIPFDTEYDRIGVFLQDLRSCSILNKGCQKSQNLKERA